MCLPTKISQRLQRRMYKPSVVWDLEHTKCTCYPTQSLAVTQKEMLGSDGLDPMSLLFASASTLSPAPPTTPHQITQTFPQHYTTIIAITAIFSHHPLRRFSRVRVVVVVETRIPPPPPGPGAPDRSCGTPPGGGTPRGVRRLQQLGKAAYHVYADVFLALLEPSDQLVRASISVRFGTVRHDSVRFGSV